MDWFNNNANKVALDKFQYKGKFKAQFKHFYSSVRELGLDVSQVSAEDIGAALDQAEGVHDVALNILLSSAPEAMPEELKA